MALDHQTACRSGTQTAVRVGLPCQQTSVLRPARVSVMDENSKALRNIRPESPFLQQVTSYSLQKTVVGPRRRGAQRHPQARPSPRPRKERHKGWSTARASGSQYYIIIHNISHSSFPP